MFLRASRNTRRDVVSRLFVRGSHRALIRRPHVRHRLRRTNDLETKDHFTAHSRRHARVRLPSPTRAPVRPRRATIRRNVSFKRFPSPSRFIARGLASRSVSDRSKRHRVHRAAARTKTHLSRSIAFSIAPRPRATTHANEPFLSVVWACVRVRSCVVTRLCDAPASVKRARDRVKNKNPGFCSRAMFTKV